MFTNFSGNTRRPRNVNLGGRRTHAFGSTGPGTGSQAALDRAQQDRLQRQRERDELKAAKTIQTAWRGYASRQTLASLLRREWDAVEDPQLDEAPYSSEREAYAQLRRLVRFANTRDSDDVRRIRRFASRQQHTVQQVRLTATGPWPAAYLRLQSMMLTLIERQSKVTTVVEQLTGSLRILGFLAGQIPAETSQHADRFYATLARVISQLPLGGDASIDQSLMEALYTTSTSPLATVTGYTLNAYEAFGFSFLALPALSVDSGSSSLDKFRDSLADAINSKLLANALATSFKQSGLETRSQLADTAARLRFLGAFVYFHRYTHNLNSFESYAVHKDFVTVVSPILNSLPTNIIESSGSDTDKDDGVDVETSNAFLKDQILSLVNQEGIGNLLAGSSHSTELSEDERIEESRQLANYALALLHFFPKRGDEIRMWLYMGPSSTRIGKGTKKGPAIKYFWEASKLSSVFKSISRDSRVAINLLRPKGAQPRTIADSHARASSLTQHAFWQASRQEAEQDAVTADEWRVILVFLELYTFVLKVTDDEDFFSSGHDGYTGQMRDNSLPLSDIKELTTFLKNLGFTLYFNAADINSQEERESSSTGFGFFGRTLEAQPQRQAEPSVGGVAGLSLDHVKGLVTGLLRMIYERDSRRKFLPSEHWLMTSRFDMTSFIPQVVGEEENRHKLQEEDADDAEEEEEEFNATPQLIGTTRTQYQLRQERIARQQRKLSRMRYLQKVAPRLEILQNMPFFIPFTTRVQIFREFVNLDMIKRRGSTDPEAWRWRIHQLADGTQQFDKHSARIRREHEFDDAFAQFYPLGQGLKEPIQITFVDQFDQPEAGIDGGGVTKEFLTSVTNRAFLPSDDIEMFVENEQHLLYPNPAAVDELKERLRQAGISEKSADFRAQVSQFLHRFEFLGRIIGKCMYEGILVDVNFAPFFLRKWALTGGTGSAPNESGYRPSLNDLRDLDEGLYQGLHQLKNYDGDVEDFALNFTVTDTIIVDHTTKKTKAITRELKPGGANTPVTNQNRLVYISYMARHRLQNQPYAQTAAFLRGLSAMIQPSWLSMFNQSELQTLVGGSSSSIDIEDLRRNTLYGGTYVIGDDGREHPTIQLFWKIMKDLSDGERRAVLKFVTSTPRAPLLGFGTLNPRFSIRDAGSDQERLPSTSTCVNLLKLPMYKEERVLKEKLLYSVFSGAGFDLS